MIVDTCDYIYDDVDLSIDSLDAFDLPFSPWDKFSEGAAEPYGSIFEELQSDLTETLCCTRNLMWGGGAESSEGETKKSPSEKPATPVPTPVKATPPPPTVATTPPNQRSLLIKSQPHYSAVSSDLYSPPISDDEDDGQTTTQKLLGDHIKDCSFKDLLQLSCETEYFEFLETICEKLVDNDVTKYVPPPQSPPPRPSFEMDHCYSKEAEPDDDGPYDSNLGVDTPSETEDEEEIEKADESYELEDEKEQDYDDEEQDDDEEEAEEEEEDETGKHMANSVDDDDEEEEIDVVSVSDHSVDIRGGINSYLYPKANITRNVYGSYGTIPKKTLPIPERKCVNGKYILMDMEVPTPVKRNASRSAPKPVSKKRRHSSTDDEVDDVDEDSDSESSYKHSYSRFSSRKSRSPPKKRRISDDLESGSDKRNLHNSLERMRRIGLKNLFEMLRNSIPSISQRDRTAKVVILNTATSTVAQVQKQEEKYAAEKVALKRKQEALRKRLSELRKSAARFR